MALRYKLCFLCGGEEMTTNVEDDRKTTGLQKTIALGRSLQFFDDRLFVY
jgi:hypothetical protein